MNEPKYKEYFEIDPKYYASVTEDLIASGEVKWQNYYPHDSFNQLINAADDILSGKANRSVWVEGAYGAGKSHAALTLESLLEAEDGEVRAYFDEYGLNKDLAERLIADKNQRKLITAHRVGSSSIRSDNDLIAAVQSTVISALDKHGIENKAPGALREAAIRWLSQSEANKAFFSALSARPEYAHTLGGLTADQVIERLKSAENEVTADATMSAVMKLGEDNGITPLKMDAQMLAEWLKSVVTANDIAILFVWDEFTEYFKNNQNSLTGFQTLLEVTQNHPFYFLIITHDSGALIKDASELKKLLNRFHKDKTLRLELPDNMAFRLMNQAMKLTGDPVKLNKWHDYSRELSNRLYGARREIIKEIGKESKISDEDLDGIFPIHPYAGLILKHIATAFDSNARSMFDFIKSNDVTDAKGFKWYMNSYGFFDGDKNLLAVDMLWDFFTGKDRNDLGGEVKSVIGAYENSATDKLTPDEDRVFKTVLILDALSRAVHKVDILRPTEQNIELAFSGVDDWNIGKAKSIAERLAKRGYIFEKPARGVKEYTAARIGVDNAEVDKIKEEERNRFKLKNLIDQGLSDAIALPESIKNRYELRSVDYDSFKKEINSFKNKDLGNKFGAIVTFAKDDNDKNRLNADILNAVRAHGSNLIYIEATTPLGTDRYDKYIENLSLSKYHLSSDKGLAKSHENEVIKLLEQWKDAIQKNGFHIYTPEHPSGKFAPDAEALYDELKAINVNKYPAGIERFKLNDTMFNRSSLKSGALYGIRQEPKGSFKSSNKNTSFETNLAGAWQVPEYWKDPKNINLIIVRMKNKAEAVIKKGFEAKDGRVSVMDIFEALEEAPFGFLPNNASAFIMGFLLKEYASPNYYWSNGELSKNMSEEALALMINDVLTSKLNHTDLKNEAYIVAMSAAQRRFLEQTARAFSIDPEAAGSVEALRDRMQMRMQRLSFPIWSIKYALDNVDLNAPKAVIEEVLDLYGAFVNTENAREGSESAIAEKIGALYERNAGLADDLKKIINDQMTRTGMKEYVKIYSGGELIEFSKKTGDYSGYLERVKSKFSSAANWVWNIETVNEAISHTILEYKIADESNKYLRRSVEFDDAVRGWKERANELKIAYEPLKKYADGFENFIVNLNNIITSKQLSRREKQDFYDALISEGEAFNAFYKDQYGYLERVNSTYLTDIDSSYYPELFNKIENRQFIKSESEYFENIHNTVTDFKNNMRKKKLDDIWLEKTGSKSPADWSSKHLTPILYMVEDYEHDDAKKYFGIISQKHASERDIDGAISFLEHAGFIDKLNDEEYRDKRFLERIAGVYGIMFNGADELRERLASRIGNDAYNWPDSPRVKATVKNLAEQNYKSGGMGRAKNVVENMSVEDLRKYLNRMISDNMNFGIEILKDNEEKR